MAPGNTLNDTTVMRKLLKLPEFNAFASVQRTTLNIRSLLDLTFQVRALRGHGSCISAGLCILTTLTLLAARPG